jgi:GNAT superfamily N-acetyltransferase
MSVGCGAVPVQIRPVESRRELKRFIKLPMRLYRNEPLWVAPLILERIQFLDRRKNPFFRHAEVQYFMAWRDGRPVGRISAHVDRDMNEYHGNRWGLFGFFECEDDPEAAQALFDAAEAWHRERGRDRMIGPMDFTMNDECGILIEGHHREALIRQPWTHRYYPALIESAGLGKAVDILMCELWVDNRDQVMPVLFELAEKIEQEHQIRIRRLDKRRLSEDIEKFVEVYNAAWHRNWGFSPMRAESMEHEARQNRLILDTDWMMLAETADGEITAAGLTVPDFNQVLSAIGNGRLLPLGWLRALRTLRRIDRVRVGFLGVKPEYQHTGIAAALYAEHFDTAERKPQKGGEMGWILENNKGMVKAVAMMGGVWVKRYRIYEKLLEPGAEPAGPGEPEEPIEVHPLPTRGARDAG